MTESLPNMERTTTSSGNPALDELLHGGLTKERLYLIEGTPGTGKTTLALQFLIDGAMRGERGLYVTLSETKNELMGVAASHGWSLNEIDVHELVDPGESLQAQSQYTMFEPSEIELGNTIRAVLQHIDDLKPTRVAFDSLSEMRLLAQGPLRYRRQILALKQFFVGKQCTVMLLDDMTSSHEDQQLQSIAHGVISLEQELSDFGSERRRLRIVKHRGCAFQGGAHDYRIEYGGLQIFPRVLDDIHSHDIPSKQLQSGHESLDALVGGGFEAGTSALLLGPAGVGKSTCASQYAAAAAARGDRAVLLLFEESQRAFLQRCKGLNIDLEQYLGDGRIEIHQLDPGEITPGELAQTVRQSVKPDAAGRVPTVVVIDSLNGYLNAMPHERHLIVQMHELLKFLGNRGIVTFVVVAQHGLLGQAMTVPVDASYLADAVLLFRYFEAAGQIRQAVSVLKKRTGSHERTIREFKLSNGRIEIGEPLAKFMGVLTGTPQFDGTQQELLGHDHET